MFSVGIDPGSNGAIAVYDGEEVTTERFNKLGYAETISCVSSLILWAKETFSSPGLVWIEKVHSMPKQGVKSSFTFGTLFGIQIGVVGMCGVPWELVPPADWMSLVRAPQMRKASKAEKLRARKDILKRLVPGWEGHLDEVDAALIAIAAWRQLGGG